MNKTLVVPFAILILFFVIMLVAVIYGIPKQQKIADDCELRGGHVVEGMNYRIYCLKGEAFQ